LRYTNGLLLFLLCFVYPNILFAVDISHDRINLTHHAVGLFSLFVFAIAYLFVMAEEITHLRKSKPVILAAGIIWGAIALTYVLNGQDTHIVESSVRHYILEFAELFLFLLVAMTYINAMDERLIFGALRAWMVNRGFGLRKLFWITGILSFFISPIADNLTTALLMCAVVLAVGGTHKKFVSLACINIVVAANAGGAFSPFGDITTLLVWQEGVVEFSTFFLLFIPSVVNFLIPAAIMHFAVPNEFPPRVEDESQMKRGAHRIMILFLLTIATAVGFHNFLGLPPMIGMMTGLAYLQIFGFYLRITHNRDLAPYDDNKSAKMLGDVVAFDIFRNISRAEWDTLLFFYGVVLCVGGLGFMGFLAITSEVLYTMDHTLANGIIGILSSIIDNIPVMFAVLSMQPDMSLGQWLMVTLTAGVGGSLLSVGSAAGVALMGQSKGMYTFLGHLRWTPAIFIGYIASMATHLAINGPSFGIAVNL